MDINKHKFFMMQILKDIYSDRELSVCLGFKGGTALMFFYNLPRFSVDLDFNLLDKSKEEAVFGKMRRILLKYGKIDDEAMKFYGPIIVLDYGAGERKHAKWIGGTDRQQDENICPHEVEERNDTIVAILQSVSHIGVRAYG